MFLQQPEQLAILNTQLKGISTRLKEKDNRDPRRIGSAFDSYNEVKQKQYDKKNILFIAFFVVFCVTLGIIAIQSSDVEGSYFALQQVENITELITSSRKLENYSPPDYYWFSVSIRDMILNSDLNCLYRRSRKPYQMTKQQHLRSILLTQLVHNIDHNGNIAIQLSPFDTTVQQKSQIISRILQLQRSYYQQQYQISQYQSPQKQLPFCIVIPSYNNVKSKLYLRNLDSIFMQQYKNYHVVYIDDNSPQKTGEFVKRYIDENQIPEGRIKIVVNSYSKKALENIYEGVYQHCREGEIIGLIDGDDSLNGRLVLKLYNAVYHKTRAALVYSNFLKISDNARSAFGFGREVTEEYYRSNLLRQQNSIIATHFMTFYRELFTKISKSDLCYQNGTFYDYAYDRAILTPLIQLSYPRIYYLKEMVYEYRNDTGINDNVDDWQRVSALIRQREPYKRLERFQFIDENQVIVGRKQ